MQAFPFQHKDPTTGLTNISVGMTMRDYFAAQAMQATVGAWISRNIYPETDLDVALNAYRMADAMMEARK
jgi:hypothetical protein